MLVQRPVLRVAVWHGGGVATSHNDSRIQAYVRDGGTGLVSKALDTMLWRVCLCVVHYCPDDNVIVRDRTDHSLCQSDGTVLPVVAGSN